MTEAMEILVRESAQRQERSRSLYESLRGAQAAIVAYGTQDLQGALSIARETRDGSLAFAIRRELLARQARGESIALRPSR